MTTVSLNHIQWSRCVSASARRDALCTPHPTPASLLPQQRSLLDCRPNWSHALQEALRQLLPSSSLQYMVVYQRSLKSICTVPCNPRSALRHIRRPKQHHWQLHAYRPRLPCEAVISVYYHLSSNYKNTTNTPIKHTIDRRVVSS